MPSSSYGGVALLIRDDVEYARRTCSTDHFAHSQLEVCEIMAKCKRRMLRLINVYCPPVSQRTRRDPVAMMRDIGEHIREQSGNDVVVLGDMTVHNVAFGDSRWCCGHRRDG